MAKGKKGPEDFVHCHTHSDMSQLDGCGRIGDYVDEAKRRGNPAIAFTEHGSMRGYLQLQKEAEKAGVKPIYGIEFYVSPDMKRKGLTPEERAGVTEGLKKSEHRAALKEYEEREGIRDRWHTTCWAMNAEGMRNLQRLSSRAYIEGFYYKPRVDIEALCEHSEGLAISTGCLSSPTHDMFLQGKKRSALGFVDRLAETYGDRFYLEIQPHAIKDQMRVNEFALKKLKDRTGARLLATQDAHYVHQHDHHAHDLLLCIGTGAKLTDEDRFRFDGDEFYFRTRRQMRDAFERHNGGFLPRERIKEALDSTVELASRCAVDVEIDYKKALLPDPGIPKKYKGNAFSFLKDLCLDGWTWRAIPERARAYAAKHGVASSHALSVYAERLKMELRTLKRQRFESYFLVVRDLYGFAREQGIMCGPGRGSAGGSLVAFLLGITSVDPIEYGLLFERFINPDRNDLPDIDMDFEDARRREVIDYLVHKYGQDKVCQIATVGRLSGKSVLRDVSRVLGVPLAAVNEISPSIIERPDGHPREYKTIEDSFTEFDVCRRFGKRFPDVSKYASRLEGMAKTLGIHAAGVVASPVTLTDLIPLEIRKHKGDDIVVSAVDMNEIASVGLVKLDVLGLRTLTVVRDCVDAVAERHGVKLDMERIDMNDPDVLKRFTDHDFAGVFQYDTPSAYKICQGVVFEDFEDIAAMTALNRPGATRSGLSEKYLSRKKDPSKRDEVDYHPAINEICADTLGVIVYQEHVIKIFTQVAGFAPGKADTLRKAIGKKKAEVLKSARADFVEGCNETSGITAKMANKIFSAIEAFGCLHPHESVLTPNGPVRICDLSVGDEVVSMDEDDFGPVVNRIKAIGSSGRKLLFKVRFSDGGSVLCSDSHLWLTDDGYFPTYALVPGTCLLYPTGLSRIGGECVEEVRCEGVSSSRERSARNVLDALPTMESTASVERGEPDRVCEQQNGVSRVGVEEGLDEGSSERKGASGEGVGKIQSRMDRRSNLAVSTREGQASFGSKGVPKVRTGSGSGSFGAKHEDASCPSQEPRQIGQPTIEPGSDLPGVSFEGASGGKGKREIASIEEVGVFDSWDLECENGPANYIAHCDGSPVVCHNSYGFNKSHATAYAAIGYWCQFLKVYYPTEFYWALLKNEPDHARMKALAKEAKKEGIHLLDPHVSFSKDVFGIDPDGNVRGSLIDIKGVGAGAAATVMEHQPFSSFVDFAKRIDRRKCNRGVVVAMIKAGALKGLIPNQKFFEENLAELWAALTKKRNRREAVADFWKRAKEADDYTEEDRMLVAAKVNPLAFGDHPLDAYQGFIDEHVSVPMLRMTEDAWTTRNGKAVYVAGLILDSRVHQVGDFHTGELPDEEERRKMFWGMRYANLNVEGAGGMNYRVKFDIDIFEDHREIVEADSGTPVIIHASVDGKYNRLKAHFAVNLELHRQAIRGGAEPGFWGRLLSGDHPARSYPWKDQDTGKKRRSNNAFLKSRSGGLFTGLVTHVRLKFDSKGREMAFFGLLGERGYIDVIAFSSVWAGARKAVRRGRLVSMQIDKIADKERGVGYFFNGGKVRVLKKVSADWRFPQ